MQTVNGPRVELVKDLWGWLWDKGHVPTKKHDCHEKESRGRRRVLAHINFPENYENSFIRKEDFEMLGNIKKPKMFLIDFF